MIIDGDDAIQQTSALLPNKISHVKFKKKK